MKTSSSFIAKANIYKFFLPFLLILSASCSLAQPLEPSLKSNPKEHAVQSVDAMIISRIKREFGRQDLDVLLCIAQENALKVLNTASIASLELHSFNTKKQKCLVTVKTTDAQNLTVAVGYRFSKIIPILNRKLKSGSLILSSDLVLQRCEMPFVDWNEKCLLDNRENIVGRQLTKSVKAGKPLYDSFFTNYSNVSGTGKSSGDSFLSGSFFGSAFSMAGKLIGGIIALAMVGFIVGATM
jgi:hypothetical protein